MRITNNMLVKDMLWNANNNLVQMAQRQTELSSGKKIHRPSDDPVGITQVLKYKTDIREAQQYKKNIDDSLGWLEVSESAMHNLKDILQRVRELTVQAANGTNTTDDRQKIGLEVEQLMQEVLSVGNSTNAGRYVFSGLQTNEKLFNPDGTFNLEMTSDRLLAKRTVEYEVSVGTTLDIGTHPVDIFGAIPNNNFFSTMITNSSVTTDKATKSTFTATVDPTLDFTGDAISFNIGGTNYSVDTSVLTSTAADPMTKTRLIDAIKNATDGGTGILSDSADVYFDANDQLVVQSNVFGAGTAITPTITSTNLSVVSNINGVDGSTETLSSTASFFDTDVDNADGIHQLVFQVDDKRVVLDIDFDTLTSNDKAGLQIAVQNSLDANFGVGFVSVDSDLNFTVVGPSDGQIHQFNVDYISSSESEMVVDFKNLVDALNTGDDSVIQTSLGKMDMHLDRIISVMGEMGGKTNRIEFIKSRVEENEITFTGLLSKVQDVDMAEAIMYFKNLENIYRASLSVGSKVIQPSLVDFIR
ncbi:MAG: flagellar hook-associated protein FlgL [Clostridiales bacterium]|nr:flagellar hook-associated protein FlgL [Clostridiales bacterium]